MIFLTFFLLSLAILACEKDMELRPNSNRPPVITSVHILPEKPHIDSDLNPIVQCNDPDGDPVTYSYLWIRNDEEIIGEKQSLLKSGLFKKGDLIQVKIIPSDGKVEGKPYVSPPVRILNSAPEIEEVSIQPKMAHADDRLKAIVKASDKDRDFIYFNYRWERNGVPLPEENTDVLEKGKFKKGDSIVVIVTPDDREILGSPKKSESVVISNSPPLIFSSPPTSSQGNSFSYRVQAQDPDGDVITFALRKAPKGMEIDNGTGLIRWEISKEARGAHSIEIEAADKEGATSLQRFTLNVDFKQFSK